MYDYLLGGKENFVAGRAVAEKLVAVYPPILETVPETRRFTERAITWVAGRGITQFINLGAGLPTVPSTHATAQAASPAAAVAYVDNDLVVTSHLTALLAHHADRVAVIAGDLRDRDAILGAAGLRAVIDLGQPACVIMGMILHFEPADAAGYWRHRPRAAGPCPGPRRGPPGAYLALPRPRAPAAGLRQPPGQGTAAIPAIPPGPAWRGLGARDAGTRIRR